jgi:hypothetical protein
LTEDFIYRILVLPTIAFSAGMEELPDDGTNMSKHVGAAELK